MEEKKNQAHAYLDSLLPLQTFWHFFVSAPRLSHGGSTGERTLAIFQSGHFSYILSQFSSITQELCYSVASITAPILTSLAFTCNIKEDLAFLYAGKGPGLLWNLLRLLSRASEDFKRLLWCYFWPPKKLSFGPNVVVTHIKIRPLLSSEYRQRLRRRPHLPNVAYGIGRQAGLVYVSGHLRRSLIKVVVLITHAS